jgi:hypothetical protein
MHGGEMLAGLQYINLRGIDHFEGLAADEKIILK